MNDIEIFKNTIINNLNIEQLNSVEENEHSTRIIAGPGTGKTTTLIAKVLYLIFIKNVEPRNILVVTFTNKAKQEIEERILRYFPNFENDYGMPNIYTYHSLATYLLRIELSNLEPDWNNFKIIDTNDQTIIIKQIIKRENISDIKPSQIINNYSHIVELVNSKKTGAKLSNSDKLNDYEIILDNYLLYKQENRAFDFNDLVPKAIILLEKNPEVKEKWQRFFKYLLVDEFQDTNNEQFELLRLLSNSQAVVSVVGDPDQNLYSWRGANIKLILNFENFFSDVKTFYLIQNYRSTPEILEPALKIIRKNSNRIDHELFSNKKSGNKVLVNKFNSRMQEARFVAQKIKELRVQENYKYHDFAVIYRTNKISQEFETALINANIPYKVIGGFKFYDRKEIREVLNLVAFLFTKEDFYFEQIYNVPSKGIGEVSYQKIVNYSYEQNYSLWSALKEMFDKSLLSLNKAKSFIDYVSNFRIENLNKNNFSDSILNYLKEINFLKTYEFEEARIENVKELIMTIRKELDFENIIPSFIVFLQKASLHTSQDDNNFGDLVTLITAHSAKGTEFENVFLVAMNEGLFPLMRNFSISNKDLEEERRAFYVSFTRAKQNLFVSYSYATDFSGNILPKSSFLRDSGLVVSPYKDSKTIYIDDELDYQETYTNNNSDQYFRDNSIISVGDNIIHNEYGVGAVIEDLDKFIKVAFDKKYGLKILVKNNKAIKKYEE